MSGLSARRLPGGTGGALLILLGVGVCLLLLAADALEAHRRPAPRWWWRALFEAYTTAAVAGVSLATLLALAGLGRERELGLLALAVGMPGARLRLWAARGSSVLVSLLLALIPLTLLWLRLASSGGIAASQVVWLHAQLLSLGLGLAASLLALQVLGVGQRSATLGLGVLLLACLGSMVWAPPLLSPWMESRHYAPLLIASNPLLAAHTAAGHDILRSGLWYGASTLGTSRFVYPAAPWTLLPGALLVLLAGGLVLGGDRRPVLR